MSSTSDRFIAAQWVARAKKGKEAELRDVIARVITPSRNDPGNIDYEVYEDEGQPGKFVIYERWTSPEALRGHTKSSWIPDLIPPLLELIEGDIEDSLSLLRPIRPVQ